MLAVDEVMAGRAQNAFCAVRPCGHHATPARPMGFCIFNNVASPRHALEVHGLERVAIIDFDVHHGNGTEDIQPPRRERVLMASFFQHPFYPGSGADNPAPNMVNVPVPPAAAAPAARRAIEKTWMPALDDIQAADDLHLGRIRRAPRRPAGQLALVEADYAWMTRE